MKYAFFFLIVIVTSCVKSSSTLVCGDHECINKLEAKLYFEENLVIEVQIKTNGKDLSYDLVDLNLNEKSNIQILKKKNKKIVRKLSKEEIKKKNKDLNKKSKNMKKTKKNLIKNDVIQKKKDPINSLTKNTSTLSSDICLKLKKCDIDSITNYLIKISNEKDFPNISLEE